MISKFFIDRPVFASVLSVLIVLAGVVSIANLPIARFPDIVPPAVAVRAAYPGANAETVAQSVAAPIEQQLSGAQNLIYYQSRSSNDGSMSLTATFDIGTNQDLAAVDVQNRLAIAQPRLPNEVVRQGITVLKTSSNIVAVVGLVSNDPQYDEVFLSNYATINVVDALKRIPGAGDVTVFGAKDYSMRIWVNPDRLSERGLTVTDVAAAIREQNAIFPAGRIGQRPTGGQEVELTVPVLTRGRLSEPSEYENIILKTSADGSILRLKDVAHVELGSQSYDLFGRLDGTPTTLIIINLQTGANAITLLRDVQRTMDTLAAAFPRGVSYTLPYETVRFIQVSIEEVVTTLAEAVGLVLLVVFIFLQNWRATLIPLLAVPVSIVGAFAGMLALGFSINTLTLFGLVLAIGIVVDDAIVVVENVERIIQEEHLPVREATIKAMSEVTGPVIAIVLVLSAVFLPVAFLGGLTGELYRQFAVTIAVSVALSGLVALTLSPALCRLLLRPHDAPEGRIQHVLDLLLFRWFNWGFGKLVGGYSRGVRWTIRLGVLSMLVFGALCFATWGLFQRVPSGFIPEEDQGYVIAVSFLPDGASLDRTEKVVTDVEQFFLSQKDAVSGTVSLGGIDLFNGFVNSTNAAVTFVRLKPWDERTVTAQELVGRAWGRFGGYKEAMVIAVNPPAIQGLGTRAGFEFQLEGRTGQDAPTLAQVTGQFMAAASKRPEVTGLNGTLRVNQPQLFIDLDRDRAKTAGVRISDVFDALQAYLGALYVNDFDKFGRVWRVQLQAEPQFRRAPEDIGRIYVRNQTGQSVPLSGLLSTKWIAGPNIVSRFNGFPAVQVTGAPAPGYSTGQAMRAVMEAARESLPAGYNIEWSGASYQEIKAGNAAPIALAFGILVVFLVLAAQYENWALPIAVLLVVPLGVLGALIAIWARHIDRDIYFQVGLLTLVGLSAKNAILIIEFCVVLRREGKGLIESAVQAARLRFRPIVMTSLAFVLGVLPLVVAKGAGAAGRHSIGTGIMGGMIAATVLAVFFVPLFFVIVQGVVERVARRIGVPPPGAARAKATAADV
jgi:hydrophobe/amphiphile efflux-1 (HAE1) family protein